MIDLEDKAGYHLPSVYNASPHTTIHEDIQEVLYDAETIKAKVQELAEKIKADYPGEKPVLICIMKGAAVFCHDLTIAIGKDSCEVDAAKLKSYEGTKSTGELKIIQDISTNIAGRDVVIIEDIVDTGHTLSIYKEMLQKRHPKSVKICSLLDKPSGREPAYQQLVVDYIGFEIGNHFIVGYGLDYNQKYREIPYIGVLKEEVYA